MNTASNDRTDRLRRPFIRIKHDSVLFSIAEEAWKGVDFS